MSKSYVTIAYNVCPVCEAKVETNELLMDTKLRDIFERETCTGYEFCDEHKKQHEDGYIFLIATDNKIKGNKINFNEANRTGEYAAIKRDTAKEIFRSTELKPINFCEPEVIEYLKKLTVKAWINDDI